MAQDDIGFLVKLIHDRIEKNANKDLSPFDLTLSQGRVLGYLQERTGQVTSQKDIEAYLGVTHPTTAGILRRLESKGLIATEFDGDDRRVKNVHPTPQGLEVYQTIVRSHGKMESNLLRGLTTTQRADLVKLLKLVYRNIQD
jgi:MarR family transcriptional regulator, repressor for mepA